MNNPYQQPGQYGPPPQQPGQYGPPSQGGNPYQQQPGQYGPPPNRPPDNAQYGPPPGQPQYGGMPASAQNANPFFALNGADPTGGNRYPFLKPGYHILEIDKVSMIEARQSRKLLYTVEFTMLATTCAEPNLQPGGKCTAMIDMSNADTRDRHVKRLIAAVLGSDPTLEQHKGPTAPDGQPWDVHAVASIGAAQPWRGRRIGCYSHDIETKSGDDFTVNDWLPEATAAQLLQQAQQVRAGAPSYAQPQHPDGVGASNGARPQAQPGAPAGYPVNGQGAYPGPASYAAPQGQPGYGGPPQGAPQGQPGYGGPPQGAPQGQPGYGGPPQGAPQGQPQGQPQGAPQGQPPGWPQWGG